MPITLSNPCDSWGAGSKGPELRSAAPPIAPAGQDEAWPDRAIIFSTCIWCREVIAQPEPAAPWMSGEDEPYCDQRLHLPHAPDLVRHDGCDLLHASEADARRCARKGQEGAR